MDAGIAIRAVDLGKCFPRDGWEPHLGMHRLVEKALRTPFHLLGRSLGNSRQPATTEAYFWALRGVSFEIPCGQVTGLIGPNGAGKSVLLKMLARVTQPSAGFAEIRGRVAAILEGGAAFHPELTGRENLRLSGILFGMDAEEVRRKFEPIVAFAEAEPFLDTPVKHYSTGMVVRLALGVAVHLARDVLLIDESLATGDEAFRSKCIQTLRSLAAEGRTVVFVSHDQGLVSQLCQRCLYLEGGRLFADGPTAEILAGYGARARRGAQPAAAPSTAGSR
jgi:lipopolysaccharide transport system ATP-binding protein